MEHGTSQGRFLIEFEGVSAVRCSDVSGLNKQHEEFELYESNRPNPHIGRGHFKIDKVKFKHAHALNSTGEEWFRYLNEFVEGISVERRNFRLIVLDEDGESPVAIYEVSRCIPISFAPDTHTAGGKDASYFNFECRGEDMLFG